MLRAVLQDLLIALLCFGLYFRAIYYDFAYDDGVQITDNSSVISGLNAQSLRAAFTEPSAPGSLFRPLTVVSFQADASLSNLSPRYFHLVNILLYAICCILVRRLLDFQLRDSSAALFCSAFFAAHPLHVEAVANIAARGETLALIFGIASLLALCVNTKAFKLRLSLSSLMLLLALYTKESALVFIPITLGYIAYYGRARLDLSTRKLSAVAICFLVCAALVLTHRYSVLGDKFTFALDTKHVWPENPLASMPFFQRLLPALMILGDYLKLLFLPLSMSADYSIMPQELLPRLMQWSGLSSLMLLSLFVIAIYSIRKNSLGFWGFWFLAGFSLTCNILAPIGTVMGDRLAFTPSLGFIVLLFFALRKALPNLAHIAATLCLVFWLALSSQRLPVWADNRALFTQTAIDAPLSPKAKYLYGTELFKEPNKTDLAEQQFRAALQLNPYDTLSMRLMAEIALRRRDFGRLEYWYRRILSVRPGEQDAARALARLEAIKSGLNNSR